MVMIRTNGLAFHMEPDDVQDLVDTLKHYREKNPKMPHKTGGNGQDSCTTNSIHSSYFWFPVV